MDCPARHGKRRWGAVGAPVGMATGGSQGVTCAHSQVARTLATIIVWRYSTHLCGVLRPWRWPPLISWGGTVVGVVGPWWWWSGRENIVQQPGNDVGPWPRSLKPECRQRLVLSLRAGGGAGQAVGPDTTSPPPPTTTTPHHGLTPTYDGAFLLVLLLAYMHYFSYSCDILYRRIGLRARMYALEKAPRCTAQGSPSTGHTARGRIKDDSGL